MPQGRSYYPGDQSVTEVSGVVDPTAMMQSLLQRETQALTQQARRPVAVAAPRQSTGTARGVSSSPRATSAAEIDAAKMRQIEIDNARREASYQERLRQADLAGPKMRNLHGGAQVTGGFITDENSLPWSMRPQGSGHATTLTGYSGASASPQPGFQPAATDMFTAMNHRAAAVGGQSLAESNAQRPRYAPRRG